MDPRIALNIQKPEQLKSLAPVWQKFSKIEGMDGARVDTEWHTIAINFVDNEIEKERLSNLSAEEFWSQLGQIKNFQDKFEYKHVAELAKWCMSLPHSNAETERVFSVVNDVKSKKRNKLGSESLDAVAKIRFSSKTCCQKFSVTDKHIALMNAKQLYG